MNWSIRIVSTLVLVSCIASCKKDKDSNAKDKRRLSKLISWKTSNPSKGIGTTEFIYDDMERVVEVAFYTGDSADGEIKNAKYRSLKFLYNGNDKNPYKTIGGMSNFSGNNTETLHTYNSNGILSRDSVAATPPYTTNIVNRYNYYPDKLIVLNERKDNYYLSVTKDSFRVANNNLVEAYYNISPYSSGQSGYKLTYDNKINPLSNLNIAAISVVNSIYGFPSYLAPGFCKNNITEYTWGYSAAPGQFTGQNVYYYTYAYNENDLPKECRISGNATNTLIKYYY